MYVASLDLCKELYGLSGWMPENIPVADIDGSVQEISFPTYDLGYLLRKLPATQVKLKNFRVEHPEGNTTHWRCQYRTTGKLHIEANQDKPYMGRNYEYTEIADTAEDAACLLAIELFKQGVLQRKA